MEWISPLIGSSNLFILLEQRSGPEATAVCSELTGLHSFLIRCSYSVSFIIIIIFFFILVFKGSELQKNNNNSNNDDDNNAQCVER